jgi:site-specific recombinase XerC
MFAAWLVDEGELSGNPLLGLKLPEADDKVVSAPTGDELKRHSKSTH